MGNHMACISPASTLQRASDDCSHKPLLKLLHPTTGAISELQGPLTAAEVMIEFPAQFLSCFSSAASNARRICAVPADEQLRATELYMLLPMHKLNNRFSMEDMAFFAAAVVSAQLQKKSSKGTISQSKVAPLPASLSCTQSSNCEGLRGNLSFKKLDEPNFQGPDFLRSHMLCRAKSWIPKLETIREANAAF